MRRGVPDNPAWRCLEEIASLERRLLAEAKSRILADERRRILAGDYAPLRRVVDAPFEPGQSFVMVWSREVRAFDVEADRVVTTPRRPLLEVAVKAKTRHRAGGCVVHFNVFDRRVKPRLMRMAPPVYDAELMKADQPDDPIGLAEARKLNHAETEKAREESHYTASRINAIDDSDAIDDDELARQRAVADGSWAVVKARELQRQRVKALARRLRSLESHAALAEIDAKPLLDGVERCLDEFNVTLIGMAA